jgi:hypothetical protein
MMGFECTLEFGVFQGEWEWDLKQDRVVVPGIWDGVGPGK